MTTPKVLWGPNPGPQTDFLAATEWEVLYGGAKGGGKSESLLVMPLRQVHIPSFKSLILRASFPELREMMDRAQHIYPKLAGSPKWVASDQRWLFSSGATIEFGYCTELADVSRYQGTEPSQILYDELGNLKSERIWLELAKEVRGTDPRILYGLRASANPGGVGHAWVKKRWIEPCGRDGSTIYRERYRVGPTEVHLERRYIPAKIQDNPHLMQDPRYVAQLMALPEMLRKALLEGDWDAISGNPFLGLNPAKHYIEPFQVPSHWTRFAAYDHGFSHPAVFILAAADEAGNVYVLDTWRFHRMLVPEIIARLEDALDPSTLRYIAAGHDCWAEIKARGDIGPTVAERFIEAGFPLMQASLSRVQGLETMRSYLEWQHLGTEAYPRCRFVDTPGNRWLFNQLNDMILDPTDPRVMLKIDANADTGEGGDDGVDTLRYLLTSRPLAATPPDPPEIRAWDTAVLQAEYERRTTHSGTPRHRANDAEHLIL